RTPSFLRRIDDRYSVNARVDSGRTDHCDTGRCALSIAPGRSGIPPLRHVARYSDRAGDSERNRTACLLDFRESTGLWRHADHARGIRNWICIWRIAGRFLERADDWKTPIPFARD